MAQYTASPEQKTFDGPPMGPGEPIYSALAAPVSDGDAESFQALERKYRHRTYQAQELMIEKLLHGHFTNLDTLQHKLHMFDIHFPCRSFMVVVVRPADKDVSFDRYDGTLRDGGQLGLIVSSIFSELLGVDYGCFPSNLDDRYAFLLNFDEKPDEDMSAVIASMCRYAVKFIRENFTLNLKVCVSSMCSGLSSLHEYFRETDMVCSDPNTRYHEGVCVRDESSGADAPKRPEPSIEKQYLNALVTQDFKTALQLTLERIQTIRDENGLIDLDRVRVFLAMRMRTTSNVLSLPMNELEVDGVNLGEACMFMESYTSVADIEKALKMIFSQLDSYFNTTVSDYTGTTGKVVSLIRKKYMEPDLSVEMICDCLGKSRSYLSRMFKENTGMNLLDYLHTTRLNEAKRLLNDTNLGIAEIAAQVGYYSGWTLARVFKRYEGITPTAYRKAFCSSSEN